MTASSSIIIKADFSQHHDCTIWLHTYTNDKKYNNASQKENLKELIINNYKSKAFSQAVNTKHIFLIMYNLLYCLNVIHSLELTLQASLFPELVRI